MIKAAVIGLGRIGWELEKDPLRGKPHSHVGAYLACPKTELVAVADTDRVKLEDFKIEHTDIAVYQDYEKMLNEVKPGIVSVATPTDTHYKIVRNAARFDCVKVIFCEKPISSTIEEARKMTKTCEQFGVKLAVNHIRRWDSAYRRVKRIVDGKDDTWSIGEPLAFSGRFSGDLIGDGVHMADLHNWFQNHAELSLLNVPTPYLVWDIDIIGFNGTIKILHNGSEIQLWFVGESSRYAEFRELANMVTLKETYDFSSAMLSAVEDLVECATSDKQPECTGEDGLYALGACLADEFMKAVP